MICKWVRVGDWLVAPHYAYPVSIGHAEDLAKENGCELPTPELVDAIWRAADLKVEPLPRKHNGKIEQMASREVFEDQRKRIEEQLSGKTGTLIAGTHKDVVRVNGKLGLYGWHRLDGTVIQPFYSKHALSWVDYSQGLRLVKRCTTGGGSKLPQS